MERELGEEERMSATEMVVSQVQCGQDREAVCSTVGQAICNMIHIQCLICNEIGGRTPQYIISTGTLQTI